MSGNGVCKSMSEKGVSVIEWVGKVWVWENEWERVWVWENEWERVWKGQMNMLSEKNFRVLNDSGDLSTIVVYIVQVDR